MKLISGKKTCFFDNTNYQKLGNPHPFARHPGILKFAEPRRLYVNKKADY
jgi:hypothetical protein